MEHCNNIVADCRNMSFLAYTIIVIFIIFYLMPGCESSVGVCSLLLTLFSMLLIVATLPLSLMFTVKVAQVTPT